MVKEDSNRCITTVAIDLVIFTFMVLGVTSALLRLKFMGNYPSLSNMPFLFTFTGLSNIFIGVLAGASGIYRLVTKDVKIPKVLFVLKTIAVADITITFLTTALYLAPSVGSIWWRLYVNSHLFNHLLTPVLSIVSFIVLEKKVETDFKVCFFAFIPIVLYGILYITVNQLHGGIGNSEYDIYGLFQRGVFVTIIFSIAFLALAFGLTVLYRFINSKKK